MQTNSSMTLLRWFKLKQMYAVLFGIGGNAELELS
jgi:hypothetical protein